MRTFVEDGLSRKARLTVNEVSKRKSSPSTKLTASNQEERVHLWKEHFKNLLVKPPNVTDRPITKIINN